MNTIKIGSYTLTTEHAASSYGMPVLIDEDGSAMGPEDLASPNIMIGSSVAINCDPCVACAQSIMRWLSQSAQHGARWSRMVRERLDAPLAEYPDEGDTVRRACPHCVAASKAVTA